MERARKWEDGMDEARPARVPEDHVNGVGGYDKVVRVAMAPARDARWERRELTKRDFAQALDLVRQSADALRITQDRAQETDARNQALMERAAQELRAAEGRIKTAEVRAQEAEARANAAEARAREVEEWLTRIHDALMEHFGSVDTEAGYYAGPPAQVRADLK